MSKQIKEQLVAEVAVLKSVLARAEAELEAFESSLGQNQYASHRDAEMSIQHRHEAMANEACEGAGNCGCSEYEQCYQITGNPHTFEATTRFEYNRYDKTYYYIDGQSYGFARLELAAEEA